MYHTPVHMKVRVEDAIRCCEKGITIDKKHYACREYDPTYRAKQGIIPPRKPVTSHNNPNWKPNGQKTQPQVDILGFQEVTNRRKANKNKLYKQNGNNQPANSQSTNITTPDSTQGSQTMNSSNYAPGNALHTLTSNDTLSWW